MRLALSRTCNVMLEEVFLYSPSRVNDVGGVAFLAFMWNIRLQRLRIFKGVCRES